jgi:hypothetical protein
MGHPHANARMQPLQSAGKFQFALLVLLKVERKYSQISIQQERALDLDLIEQRKLVFRDKTQRVGSLFSTGAGLLARGRIATICAKRGCPRSNERQGLLKDRRGFSLGRGSAPRVHPLAYRCTT